MIFPPPFGGATSRTTKGSKGTIPQISRVSVRTSGICFVHKSSQRRVKSQSQSRVSQRGIVSPLTPAAPFTIPYMEHSVPRFTNRSSALRYMQKYYLSPHWITTSRRIRSERPICELCRTSHSAQVHHLSYLHMWAELENDLMAVCVPCHLLLESKKVKERKRLTKIQQKTKTTAKRPSLFKRMTGR